MKLAVIGAGRIVDFHLPALRAAGFELAAISARPNSTNARNLAKKYDISRVFDNSQVLIDQVNDFDALLIASSSETHLDFLLKLRDINIPTLIEKPVFTDSKVEHSLFDYRHSEESIMVGYNRRFYPSVKNFKAKIYQLQGGLLSINVPELSGTKSPSAVEVNSCLRLNTVHIFDLLHFLFPLHNFSKNIYVQGDANSSLSVLIVLQGESFLIDINLTFGAPGNYKFEFRSGSSLVTLNPIERFSEFEGMLIQEPTQSNPVRTYTPRPVSVTDSSESTFKPGFLEQANHFFDFANKRKTSGHATIQDAYKVSLFVDDLIKRINDKS
ncbi:MviM Predicted dehydrogenases and related proteins [Candidatus Nanopelagicaceae bacterium]